MKSVSQSQSLSNFSMEHLDAVLAVAHMLPRQTDVSALLRMVKYCSQPLMAFQRLCLLIETPLRERDMLYTLDVTGNMATTARLDLADEEGRYTLFRQLELRLLNNEHLKHDFSAAAKLEIFQNGQQYLLLPLSVGVNGYRAVIFFVWTQERALSQEVLAFCRFQGIMVGSTLTQLLIHEEQNMAMEALRSERDRLNILVSVANVASSTLNLENLIKMVAMDLRRFFAVNDVALELNEDNDQVSVHNVLPARRGNVFLPCKDTLLGQMIFHKPFCLLREKAIQSVKKSDPLAASLLDHGDTAACGFALTFQQKPLGALIVGHSLAEIFTRDSVSLLAQIARALAQSVYHAREYAFVESARMLLAKENADLSREIAHRRRQNSAIIGQSEAIRKVLQQIEMVAPSDSTVLILGETGTGKELVAEAIHQNSQRKSKPMVKINCAAVPTGLLESELFGHEKGAFTGAIRQNKGRFEQAQDGTLFLDEVGDLPLELQPKLLRILQSRELERIGGHTVIPVNVRLVAATNQNLVAMVGEKRFREDLYYRLNVFPIVLPPLRERREDIPLLAQYFMELLSARLHKQVSRISAEGMRWLCNQDWPGNVRELANVIERAVIVSSGKILNLEMAASPSPMRRERPVGAESAGSEDGREAIVAAIQACNGLIAGPRGAAAYLGMKRTTLNSRMKRLGLNVKEIMGKLP
ncbi:MAG: sigma 54-interacting transcriptional regulator [Desulfovibrio sp.]|nr:sigma 54-interacting transcriptional regulator [Desulfovibrio sp.]